MRAIFVNHCHPDMAHVCALRLRAFAEACARAGDQIVLLTQTLDAACGPQRNPLTLAQDLAAHDWSQPFRLACAPKPSWLLEAMRAGKIMPPLRQVVVAGQYFIQGGMFTDWRDGSRPYWRALVDAFAPEIVWGSFGNTDVLQIAQGIAGHARCPWVMDLKDPWDVFIPGPFRKLLASRFHDAAALTAFSRQHADEARRRFGRQAEVIYSGVGPEFFATQQESPKKDFIILLTGGLYDGTGLAELTVGIAGFLADLPPQDQSMIRFCYAGGEAARFLDMTRRLSCRTEALGYCALPDLAVQMRSAAVNLYVRSPASLFQHKLFELAASSRPILCLPGESDEAHALCQKLGGQLLACQTARDVTQALKSLYANPPASISPSLELAHYSWDKQAEILRRALMGAAGKRQR